MGGSPFVFFGVTLSAQSDFLDLGGSELEGPDGLPLLILHLCDSNRSVGVVTVVLCAADLVLGSELDLGVGQNNLAAALECTVDGQLCQSVADGSTVGGASLLDGGLEQPHNGVGLSRVAVHVDIVDLLEVLVDLHAVGQVGVELDNRSHAVCGCAQVRDEGRIGEAVGLGNDHLGLVVLLLQGLDEQSSVADVGVAQDGIGDQPASEPGPERTGR